MRRTGRESEVITGLVAEEVLVTSKLREALFLVDSVRSRAQVIRQSAQAFLLHCAALKHSLVAAAR